MTIAPDFGATPCQGKRHLYFPPDNETSNEGKKRRAEARRTCSTCHAFDPCLNWAVDNEEHGMWAGTTRAQRDAIRDRRTVAR